MRWLRSLLAVFILLPALFLAFVYSGVYDVAATPERHGVLGWIAEAVADHSIHVRAKHVRLTLPERPSVLTTGFRHYREMCVACHGAPGVEPSEFAEGLNPRPPDLSKAARAMSPEEIFWVLDHGIKMTGMPSFRSTHSREQIEALTAFVEQLPDMTPTEYREMEQSTGTGMDHRSPGSPQAADSLTSME